MSLFDYEFRIWDKAPAEVDGLLDPNPLGRMVTCNLDTMPYWVTHTFHQTLMYERLRRSIERHIELDEKRFVIMQYAGAGLSDKNGKRYCQDDIVLWRGGYYRLIRGAYKFELVGFHNLLQDDPTDFFSEDTYQQSEIVGNAWEHPHLLQKVE